MSDWCPTLGRTYSQAKLEEKRHSEQVDLQRRLEATIRRNLTSAIGSREAFAREGMRIQSLEAAETRAEIRSGMDTIAWDLQSLDQTLSSFGAKFRWYASEALVKLGGIADSLASLYEIASTPAQTAAYEQFHIARDAFQKRLFPECLEALDRAINGGGASPGYKLEHRFHFLKGLALMSAKADPSAPSADYSAAEESFCLASRYAVSVSPSDAAAALLSAGWCAYLQVERDSTAADRALEHTRAASSLQRDLPEASFQEARLLLYFEKVKEALACLRKSIEQDPLYSVKAAGEDCFRPLSPKILRLITDVRNDRVAEVRKRTEPDIRKVTAWIQRGQSISEDPAWGRLTSFRDVSREFGLLDVCQYLDGGLDCDLRAMQEEVGRLNDIEREVASALDSVKPLIGEFPCVGNHAFFSKWRGVCAGGPVPLDYPAELERERDVLDAENRERLRLTREVARLVKVGKMKSSQPEYLKWVEQLVLKETDLRTAIAGSNADSLAAVREQIDSLNEGLAAVVEIVTRKLDEARARKNHLLMEIKVNEMDPPGGKTSIAGIESGSVRNGLIAGLIGGILGAYLGGHLGAKLGVGGLMGLIGFLAVGGFTGTVSWYWTNSSGLSAYHDKLQEGATERHQLQERVSRTEAEIEVHNTFLANVATAR